MDSVSLIPVSGIPEVLVGDDLSEVLLKTLEQSPVSLCDRDILVVSQKIVSKAEGRRVDLNTVEPSSRALEFAAQTDKDPRLVELVLRESREVLRVRPGLMIVEHRLGIVMANAGIDQSNLGIADDTSALLLPEDPDASARSLRDSLTTATGRQLAVVIIDSVGRAWREGVVGLAIGVAGIEPLVDMRGKRDRDGRELGVTQIGFADQLASAASLLMGEADESRPVIVVRGLAGSVSVSSTTTGASVLQRPAEHDLFR